MITQILYVSETDAINPAYKQIFRKNNEEGQIDFLHVSKETFRNRPQAVYRQLSERTQETRLWKLILADDTWYPWPCQGQGSNPFKDYEFKRQIEVLARDSFDQEFTAAKPADFFVLRTRNNRKERRCGIMPTAWQTEGSSRFLCSEGMPFGARYLIFDFLEENELQLFYTVWILAQDSIAMDYLVSGRVYKISAEWQQEGLECYLQEMREELDSRKRVADGLEIPGTADIPYADADIAKRLAKRMFQPLGSETAWKAMGQPLGDILKKLREKQLEIQRKGAESFRQIRQQEPKKQGGTAGYAEYEAVLISHYEVGNADYTELEAEIEDFLKENDQMRKSVKPWITGLMEFLVVASIICVGTVPDVKILMSRRPAWMFFALSVGILAGCIALNGGHGVNRMLDMRQKYKELAGRADWIISDQIKRINQQFGVMEIYRSYVYHRRAAEREAQTADDIYKKGREDGKELELEEALWEKMRAIAGGEISYTGCRGKHEHTCAILGQKIPCPYYFLEEVTITPEMETEGKSDV